MTTGATHRNLGQAIIGVPQKLLEYVMEGLYQPILFYLCPGIVFQPHMTTGATHRNLRQAKLHPTKSHFQILLEVGIWVPSKNTKTSKGRSTSTQPVLFLSRHSNSTTYDNRSHRQKPRQAQLQPTQLSLLDSAASRYLGSYQKW